jgi:hypothetical protein
MWRFNWLEIGIDFVFPALLFAVGFWLIWKGCRSYRRRAIPECFKCGYDMRESPGLMCPECGFTANSEALVNHGAVRKWRVAIGVVLCLPGLWLGAFSAWYFPGASRISSSPYHGEYAPMVPVHIDIDTSTYAHMSTPVNALSQRVMLMGFWWLGQGPQTIEEVARWSTSCNSLSLDSTPIGKLPAAVFVYAAEQWFCPLRHYCLYKPRPCYIRADWAAVTYEDDKPGPPVPRRLLDDLTEMEGVNQVGIRHAVVEGDTFEVVSRLKSVTLLRLSDIAAKPDEIACLARLKQLHSVDFTYARRVTSGDFAALKECPSLKTVYITGKAGFDDSAEGGLVELLAQERVQELFLCVQGKQQAPAGTTFDQTFVALVKNKSLKDLTLRSWIVNESACEQIARAGSLKRVAFSDVSEAGLKQLAAMANLETISVSESTLTKAQVKAIAVRHPQKTFWLNGYKITAAND